MDARALTIASGMLDDALAISLFLAKDPRMAVKLMHRVSAGPYASGTVRTLGTTNPPLLLPPSM